MTSRQQQIRDFVIARREEILADYQRDIDTLALGHTLTVRMVLPFKTDEGRVFHEAVCFVYLLVMRTVDGLVWREDNPRFHRKGWTSPAWKALT